VSKFNQKIYMKTLYSQVSTALILFMLLSQVNAGWLENIKPIVKSPRLELVDLNGTLHRLHDLNRKVVLVNFWTSWCPPCIEEMPSLVRLVETISSDELLVLAVNVNEKQARIAQIASRLELNFPVLLDNNKSVADAWGIKVYPSSFLIDSSGLLRFKAIGPVEWDSDEAVRIVKQLLAESNP
jgi:peroxiredoxin